MDDYIYSSTYLRSIEKYLLDKNDIQRMVGTKDARGAIRVLEDINYARDFKGLISRTKVEDYRDILSDDLEKAKKMLYFLTEDRNVIKFVLSFFDFHNLKLFFKEKFSGREMDEFISPHGSQKPTELRKAILDESREADIDTEFMSLITETEEKFEKNKDPYFIDTYIDKKRIEFLSEWTKKIKNEWMSNYVQRKIDILNLQNVARLYGINKAFKIKEVLLKGGSVKDWGFLNICGDIKDVLLTIRNYFDNKIKRIIDKYLEEGILWKFIKDLDDNKVDYLKSARFISCGPEIIIAYFLTRIAANRNVRIIIEGKLYGLENREIEERVRMPLKDM